MCFLSPKSTTSQKQCTTTSTNQRECNANVSGNAGTTLAAGNGATLQSAISVCDTTNTTNNISTTCAGVVTSAIRSVACLAKSVQLSLDDTEATDFGASTNLASCLTRQGYSFASNSICTIEEQAARSNANILALACNENQAVASIAAASAAQNSATLKCVSSTLSGIAIANDTSQASQSTAFASSALKIAAVVVLGLGAIAVIYAVSKK